MCRLISWFCQRIRLRGMGRLSRILIRAVIGQRDICILTNVGVQLALQLQDELQQDLFLFGQRDILEINLMQSLLKPGTFSAT